MNAIELSPWRIGRNNELILIGTLALAIWAYYGGLMNLVDRWNAEEEYNHGYFLPLVTAVFLWNLRPTLAKLKCVTSWWGPIIVAFALLMLVIGELSAIYLLIHYSFVLLLIGLSVAFLGWSGTRHTIIPIGLLIFAVPIPYFLEATITSKLQLISSKFGVYLIRLCDVPVFREGNLIDLGSFKLEVIEACSGLTYLYPLLGFGCICAYLYRAAWWKRAVIISSTVPIAILLNSFRIGLIGVLVKYFGNEQAKGFLHDFEGFAVFMVCVGILFVEMWALTLIGHDRRRFGDVFGLIIETPTHTSPLLSRDQPVAKPLVISALLVFVSALVVNSVDARSEITPARREFSSFPSLIADWQGKPGSLEPDVVKTLGLTDYLLADYTNPEGSGVNFYVAYYDSQRKGVSPHSPAVCLPGGGWQILNLRHQNLALDEGPNPFEVNRVIISKGKTKQLVYYWFAERGRFMADEYRVKWYLFRDALLDNRTDGALVRITTQINTGESEESADVRIRRFLAGVLPLLPKYVPD